MPEAARIFAFDAYAARSSADAMIAPGVTIASRRPRSMLNVRGDRDDAALAHALRESLDVTLPREANAASGRDAARSLWLGPDEWLIVADHAVFQVPTTLGVGTITDVSHGRAVLRLTGPDVRTALAKGCALDLHPREFPPNRCAQTAIAKIPVILDHVQPGVFDLYCPRSYAGSFWHWLTEAAAEYGSNIAGDDAG